MIDISKSIASIQALQAVNRRQVAELQPDGAFGRVIKNATIDTERRASAKTHVGRYVQTKTGRYRSARPGEAGIGGGALRASHRIKVEGLTGTVYIDEGSVNPLTGQRPHLYGTFEEARGGEHSFYKRTVVEDGPEIARRAGEEIAGIVVRME